MIRSKHYLALLFLILPVLPAMAGERMIYVNAGHMLDVADGRVLNDRIIVIEGDRIREVVSAGSIDLPSDAEVVDLGDAFVLPGLIDMHVHLTSNHRQHGYEGLASSVPRQALYGATNARATLMAGFTTVRNVGASGYADIALRDAIDDGELPGPRMRVSGPSLGITGGHCDNNLLPPEFADRSEGVADGPWEVRARVRENIKYGADVIKYCATGGVLSKGTSIGAQQYTLEEMQALIAEAGMHDRRVAAHAHGTRGIKAAISAGVDSVDHASLIDGEGIRMAKEAGTFLVMDVYVSTWILEMGEAAGILPESLEKERTVGQAQRDNFRRAHEAGVRMAFGSDAGVYPHGYNARQFAYMVEYGMTPMQAIQAATVEAAELLGWPGDVGAIEPGAYADLIAVPADPLEDVRALEDVRFVMKGGVIVRQ